MEGGASCDGGSGTCVPVVPEAAQCVVIEPALGGCQAPYVETHLLYQKQDSSCGCICTGDGSCASPEAVISHDDDTCGGTAELVALTDQGCDPIADVTSIEADTVPWSGGACSPTTYIDGSLVATVCCIPAGE